MTESDTNSSTPAWRRFALGACMFLSNGVNGFLQPFVTLYLAAAGLDKHHIGTVLALGTGVALFAQPLLGRVSDRIDARRPFMVLAAILSGFAYLGYRQASGFWAFVALTALGANGFQYLNAVAGVLIGRLVRAGGGNRGGAATYIAYRVWGSVGYILVGIGAGLLVNRHLPAHSAALGRAQLDGLFTYGPLLFFLIALIALLVPDAKMGDRPPPAPRRGERFSGGGGGGGLSHIQP